jgi:hypothetical protein
LSRGPDDVWSDFADEKETEEEVVAKADADDNKNEEVRK